MLAGPFVWIVAFGVTAAFAQSPANGMKPCAKFGGMVGVTDELAIWGDIWPPDGLPQPVSQPAVSPNNPNGGIQK